MVPVDVGQDGAVVKAMQSLDGAFGGHEAVGVAAVAVEECLAVGDGVADLDAGRVFGGGGKLAWRHNCLNGYRPVSPRCQSRGWRLADRRIASSVTEALKHGIGVVTVEDVRQEMANRPLVRSEVGGRAMAGLRSS